MLSASSARTAEVDEDVDRYAQALVALSRASACCTGTPFLPLTSLPKIEGSGGRSGHRTMPSSTRFVVPGVTVIEPGQRRVEADLVVEHGRIADLAPVGHGPREGIDVIESLRGMFVTPALVDMHGHLPPHSVLRLTGLFLLLHLTHGVTTVRDAGDMDGTATIEATRGIGEGRYLGPRLFSAGPFVTKGLARWPNSLHLGRDGDATAIAEELLRRGSRCMKIYENLSPSEIGALERAAKHHGLSTLGHVPTALSFEEAPLEDAQHFFGVPPPRSLPRDHVLDRMSCWSAVDDARIDAVVRHATEHQRANTPTLVVTERLLLAGAHGRLDDAATRLLPRFFRYVVWDPERGLPAYRGPSAERVDALRDAFDKKLRLVARLHASGAPLRLGTDTQQPFVVPGAALHREMQLFEAAGVSSERVMELATRVAALALGAPDLGTTRRGAVADLIVLERDPTRDLAALGTLRAVIHQGRLLSKADLDREIGAQLAARDRGFERNAAAILSRLALFRATRRFVS